MLDHIRPLPHRLSSIPLVVSLVNRGQKRLNQANRAIVASACGILEVISSSVPRQTEVD